jgi:lipopolysaccharide transport system permease protein
MSVSATKIPVSQITALEAAVEPRPAQLEPPSGVATGTVDELVIEPRRGWIAVDWRELVRSRELLYFLIWRDVKVRYKQAVLGVAWAVLQPAVQMLVFTVIFGFAANFRESVPGVPYMVFVLSALLPWQLFATALSVGGMSLVNQQHLLTKIYFPRMFIPTSVVGGSLVDMAVGYLLFAVLLAAFGIVPTWGIVALPLLVALTVMLSLGVSFLLSALTVTYRDFRFIIPFLTQLWMFVSFVFIPPKFAERFGAAKAVLSLNPMYPIIAGYRKVFLGNRATDASIGWDWRYFAVSATITVAVFALGLFYFRRTERRFADIA